MSAPEDARPEDYELPAGGTAARKPAATEPGSLLEALEMAWVIIANAGGGDWEKETEDWRKAATRWRDWYHEILKGIPKSSEVEGAQPPTK